MAENIAQGYIEIEQSYTPVLVESANLIQVPPMSETNRVRIFISKHGVVADTWIEFSDNTNISISPPYFIMCNRKIKLPAMEA